MEKDKLPAKDCWDLGRGQCTNSGRPKLEIGDRAQRKRKRSAESAICMGKAVERASSITQASMHAWLPDHHRLHASHGSRNEASSVAAAAAAKDLLRGLVYVKKFSKNIKSNI